MFKNIFKLLTLFAACSASVNACFLDYTKEGVLRKDQQCNINFVNFGIDKDISGLNVRRENNANGTFNLAISELKNGNVGLRSDESGYTFKDSETKNYVEISQNGTAIKDFEVKPASRGKFSLVVKNLKTCEGLTIKQIFKADALMNTYLYYSNVTPKDINHPFNIVEFGPSSNDVPYDTLSWNMNTGLDDLREKCRIFIDFRETNNVGGFHWVWYVSTDTVNADKCDNPTFYDIAKKSYASMEVMDELFGDHYNGYVIKREGKENGHMDGILVNQKYLIEIYQNGCDEQNKDQVICTISSNKKLTYHEFTKQFVENCSSVVEDPKEKVQWSVDEKGVTAKFDNYSLNITNKDNDHGALPKNENESVRYKEFKAANSSGIARFNVCTSCGDGSYVGEKCKCQPCPENCTKCLDGKTCTECATGSELIDGECKKIITTTTTTTTTTTEDVPTPTEVETETVGDLTEKDEPTESEEVKEEETSDANDSDEEEEEVTDEPTVVDEDDEGSEVETATEAEETASVEGDNEEEEEKPKTITKVVTMKKPKTVKKCYVKKH